MNISTSPAPITDLTPAQIIDQHRVMETSISSTRTIVRCVCGYESFAHYNEYRDVPMTGELNPRRTAERRHAEHVADMLS